MEAASPQVIAVVLAGGDRGDPIAQHAGVAAKALAPLGDRPMASYVVAALEGSATVSRMIYVGQGLDSLGAQHATAIQGGKGFAHSLALGAGAAMAVAPNTPLLVVTADVPWLTSEAVDSFVRAGIDCDLAYPIVPDHAALAAFPSHKRTFVRLKEGRFTGGNLMLLRPGLVASLLALIEALYRARKNPVALAALVGPRTLLALFTGQASLPRIEGVASERLGGNVRAVITEDACVAADVDRPEQLDMLPAMVQSR